MGTTAAATSDGVAERCSFYREVLAFYNTHPAVPRPHLMAGDFNNIEDAIDRLHQEKAILL